MTFWCTVIFIFQSRWILLFLLRHNEANNGLKRCHNLRKLLEQNVTDVGCYVNLWLYRNSRYLPVETGQGQGNTGAAVSRQARRFAHRCQYRPLRSVAHANWQCSVTYLDLASTAFSRIIHYLSALQLFPKILLISTICLVFCV